MKDGSNDSSYIESVLKKLIDLKYQGIVIIKSTILFSRIKKYLNYLNIVINPEFLNEINHIQDFKNQKYIILGGRIENIKKVENLYKKEFKLNIKKFEHTGYKTAIDFKYARNIKNALNILYWNMIQDTTNNSKKISQILENIPTIELSNIYQDGFRGFGGACLPKDINALYKETDHRFLKEMIEYNKRLKDH